MSNDEGSMETQDLTSDMPDEHQMYSAQYKDGHLHIVEVSPYDKTGDAQSVLDYESDSILPATNTDDQPKYLQLDLLNFTIVKSNDGSNTYQMVSTDAAADAGDTTITCVLSSDDVDADNQDSYVMLETDEEQDPYLYLQPSQPEPTVEHRPESQPQPASSTEKKALTPIQILEKAKALQRAKAFQNSSVTKSKRGRKRKSDLPPPMELLSSPNFKLYLYSCKHCTFKCNAVKEMSAHKKAEHANTTTPRGAGVASLQCARCPFRGHTHRQLMHHVTRVHVKETPDRNNEYITALQLDSEEVEAADVLVCGACGFESGDRALFKKHIEDEHGAITSVK